MRHSAAAIFLSLVTGSLAQDVPSNTSVIALVDAATTTLAAAVTADNGAINQTLTNLATDDAISTITDIAALIFDVSQLNTDLLTYAGSISSATTSGIGGIVGSATSVTQDDITILTGDVNAASDSITALQGIVTLLGGLTSVPQVGVAEISVIQTGAAAAVQPLVDFATQVISGSATSGLDTSALQTALNTLQTAVTTLGGITGAVTTQINTPADIAPVPTDTGSAPPAASSSS